MNFSMYTCHTLPYIHAIHYPTYMPYITLHTCYTLPYMHAIHYPTYMLYITLHTCYTLPYIHAIHYPTYMLYITLHTCYTLPYIHAIHYPTYMLYITLHTCHTLPYIHAIHYPTYIYLLTYVHISHMHDINLLLHYYLEVLMSHYKSSLSNKDLLPYLAISHVRDMLIPPSERYGFDNFSNSYSFAYIHSICVCVL